MPTKPHILLIVILLISLTACMSLAEDVTPPPGMQAAPPSQELSEPRPTATPLMIFPSEDPLDPSEGELIFEKNCAHCHGDTGQGDGSASADLEKIPAPVASPDLARQSIPIEWYRLVTQGDLTRFMPPFSNLSHQERWDVIAYLYSLSTTPETLQEGQALYLENCSECHGEDGKQGAVDFSNQEFMSERSEQDLFDVISSGQGDMPSFDNFSEEARWSLTAYVRSFSFVNLEETITIEDTDDQSETSQTQTETDTDQETESSTEDLPSVEGAGTITIEVVNPVGVDLPVMDITLRGYEEMVEVYTQTITLEEGSLVAFENTPLPLGRMYFASIEHGNAVYGSDILVLEDIETQSLKLDINYYPPTTNPSILKVDRLHIFFSFVTEEILEIYQLYIYSNPTDQVLTPGDGQETAINFTIPPNASNLYVEENMGMAYRQTENGFGIVNVYPDENAYQTIFSYQVPYEDQKLDLSIPIGLDANAVIVMAPSNGFKVRSDQLQDAGTRDIEGTSYSMFTASNLSGGRDLEVSLSGIPKETTRFISNESNSNTGLVIGLAGLGVALITTGLILWRRNQSEENEWEEDQLEALENGETADDVIDAIIALDDLYKAGGLPEDAYKQRRSELKEKLRDLV